MFFYVLLELTRFVAQFYPQYIQFAEHFQPCSTPAYQQ